MSYQIEPEEVHNKYKLETKRQSLYHYIRHASKIMKLQRGGDVRKHKSEQDLILNEKHSIMEEDIPSYYVNEKSWSVQHNAQLAFPPNNNNNSRIQKISLDDIIDDEEDVIVQHQEYITDSDYYYSVTMQKLCGVSLTKDNSNKTNTAVLISLSPVALAAANAARQRRLKTNRNTITA